MNLILKIVAIRGIESLNQLEPTGNGCPKPVLMMKKLTVERIQMVGSGKHMRLRLRSGHHGINAIYFSATPESAAIRQGDVVDVAFNPQINEFRGERTVQMNVLDIRPYCCAEASGDVSAYHAMRQNRLTAADAARLLPDRNTLAIIWRYLAVAPAPVLESPMCLCRKIVRWSGTPLELGQLMTCLDIFADVGLLQYARQHKYISISIASGNQKADLNSSATMQKLLCVKES